MPAAGLLASDGQPVREEVDDERGDEDAEDVEYAEVGISNRPISTTLRPIQMLDLTACVPCTQSDPRAGLTEHCQAARCAC